jgi:hypothetical protein
VQAHVALFVAQYGSSGMRMQHCSEAPQTLLPQFTAFLSFPSAALGGLPMAMPISWLGKQRFRLFGKKALVRHVAVVSSHVSPAWQSSNQRAAPIMNPPSP